MTWTADKYTRILHNALQGYETDHPHWQAEVLVSLIQWALRRLEYYIELETETEVDWDSPFVELHFPVEWDWEAERDGDVTNARWLSGKITAENTADEARARKTLGEIMVRHLNLIALQELTNHAWFEKRGDIYTPFLPVHADQMLKGMRSKTEQRRALEEIYRPFAIGAANLDITLRKDGRLTASSERSLRKIDELLDIRSIRFQGDVQGHEVDISLVFQIHPLIADYDVLRAYQPIVVGLFIEPKISEDKLVSTTPSSWPESHRKALWRELHSEVEKLANSLIPKKQLEHSTVISVNAELEMTEVGKDSVSENAAVEAVTKTLLSLGTVRRIAIQRQAANPATSLPVPEEEQKAPATFHEAFVRSIWKTKLRTPIIVAAFFMLALFGIYAAQPTEIKIRIWNQSVRGFAKLFGH